MFDFLKKQKPQAARIEPTISNIAESVSTADPAKLIELFGGLNTDSGAVVNERTAMRVSAAYACTSLICGSIMQLPVPIYMRKSLKEREQVDHPFWWLLNERACPTYTSASFWEFITAQVLLRGDGIAYLVRNRANQITSIIPYPRDRVMIQRVKAPGQGPRAPWRLQYSFSDVDGYFGAEQEDVLHFPGFGFDGISSMSVIQWGARNGIGIAIKGDEFAGKSFAHGGKPEIAIKAPGEMTQKQQDAFRAAWIAKYSGTGPNGIPLMLTEGLDVKELSLSQQDQQVLESRQWQVIDIARAFGVPPFMIGETSNSTSWGTGLEQQMRGFVTFTLNKHLTRFEQEMTSKFFPGSKLFAEFYVDHLLEGDSAAQAAFFAKALGGPGSQGFMAVNEVRRLKNLPPQQGDEYDKVAIAASKPAAAPGSAPADDSKSQPDSSTQENQ